MIDDVTDVFMNTDEHAEEWTWYPKSVVADAIPVRVVPSLAQLEGTREVQGDGRLLEQDAGTRLRESPQIEISSDYDITESDGKGHVFDQFKDRAGRIWNAKRVIGRDHAMQRVLVVRATEKVTRYQRRRG